MMKLIPKILLKDKDKVFKWLIFKKWMIQKKKVGKVKVKELPKKVKKNLCKINSKFLK